MAQRHPTEKTPPPGLLSRTSRDTARIRGLVDAGEDETASGTDSLNHTASKVSTSSQISVGRSAPPKRIVRPAVEKTKSAEDVPLACNFAGDGGRAPVPAPPVDADTAADTAAAAAAATTMTTANHAGGSSGSGTSGKPQCRRRPSYQPTALYSAKGNDAALGSSSRLGGSTISLGGAVSGARSPAPAEGSHHTSRSTSAHQQHARQTQPINHSDSTTHNNNNNTVESHPNTTEESAARPRRSSREPSPQLAAAGGGAAITAVPDTDDPVELKAVMAKLLKQYEREKYLSTAYRRKVSTQQQRQREQQQQQQQQPATPSGAEESSDSSTPYWSPAVLSVATGTPQERDGGRHTLLKNVLEQQHQRRRSTDELIRQLEEERLRGEASTAANHSSSLSSGGSGDVAAEDLPPTVTHALFNPHASNEELRQALRQSCLQYAVLQRRLRELEQSGSASRNPNVTHGGGEDAADSNDESTGNLKPLPVFYYRSHCNPHEHLSSSASGASGQNPSIAPARQTPQTRLQALQQQQLSPVSLSASSVTSSPQMTGRATHTAVSAISVLPSNGDRSNCTNAGTAAATAAPHSSRHTHINPGRMSASTSLISSLVSPRTGGTISEGLVVTPRKPGDISSSHNTIIACDNASNIEASGQQPFHYGLPHHHHPRRDSHSSGFLSPGLCSDSESPQHPQQQQQHASLISQSNTSINPSNPSTGAARGANNPSPGSPDAVTDMGSNNSNGTSSGPRSKAPTMVCGHSPTTEAAEGAGASRAPAQQSLSDETLRVRQQLRQLYESGTNGTDDVNSNKAAAAAAAARLKEEEEREALRQWRAEASKRNASVGS